MVTSKITSSLLFISTNSKYDKCLHMKPANQKWFSVEVNWKGSLESLSVSYSTSIYSCPQYNAAAAFRNLKLRLLYSVHFILIRLQLVKCLDKSYSHPLKKIMSHNTSPFCTIWELKYPHFWPLKVGKKQQFKWICKYILNTQQCHKSAYCSVPVKCKQC